MQKRFYIPSRKVFIKKKKVFETIYLKAIFPVNPIHSEFCGYIVLKAFACQKSVFVDFPDNAWEKPVDYPHNELPSKDYFHTYLDT